MSQSPHQHKGITQLHCIDNEKLPHINAASEKRFQDSSSETSIVYSSSEEKRLVRKCVIMQPSS